jgi:DNA polymerase-3 subunit gamma/tau
MIEALEIKDIDAMIKVLEKELRGVKVPDIVISPTPAAIETDEVITISEEDIRFSPLVEKRNPSDEALQQKESATIADTPDLPPAEKREEPIMAETPVADSSLQHRQTFDTLIKKIYDRDFDLGQCFEKNISFESYANGALTWGSMAQGDDRKLLITHWSVVKMFVQELFGIETKIINVAKEPLQAQEEPKKKVNGLEADDCNTDSGSMIETVEMKSSCIMPEAGETEAAKEKEPSSILEEPMIKEVLNLFDPKKVRIKRKV